MTPLIFVDVQGVSNEGGNYWDKLKVFIDDMCTKKGITLRESNGELRQVSLSEEQICDARLNIHLLQGHMKNTVHIVDSYDDAADIIEEFIKDPVEYYVRAGVTRREMEMAYDGALNIRRDTKFPIPSWMNGEAYGRMLEDPRWANEQPLAVLQVPTESV